MTTRHEVINSICEFFDENDISYDRFNETFVHQPISNYLNIEGLKYLYEKLDIEFCDETGYIHFYSQDGDWETNVVYPVLISTSIKDVIEAVHEYQYDLEWQKNNNKDEGVMEEKIKSDGGSSAYYLITLPKGVYSLNADGSISFMLEEYIKYGLGNDFDQGNLAKANHRIGKKEGNTKQYEKNKMKHYVERL